MKKLLYLLAAVLFTTSCKKDDTKIFEETPEERMSARIDTLNNALNGAPNGWHAYLTTGVKGGYGFYMDFKPSQSITMVADLDSESATKPSTSTYRIKWVMNATLIFDTYNYISKLQDPNPAVYGGIAGSGLQSDVEFEYQRINGDSIILRGFKYKNDLVLIKATVDQKNRYLSAAYKANIDALNNYFNGKSYNYVTIPGLNNKVQFLLDNANKIITLQYSDNNGNVVKVTGKYNYEDQGLNIIDGIVVNGVTFVRAAIENGAFVLYAADGTRYVLQQSSVPILLMQNLFAYNGLYKELYIPPNPPTGINSGFNAVYLACQTKFAQMNPPRSIVDIRFLLASSNTVQLITRNGPANTAPFTAIATYNFTYANGILTLSNPSYDGNWTQRSNEYAALQNYFATDAVFKVDYVVTNIPNLPLIGGLYKVSDNTSFFYGVLR
ncbi:hypothetical protein Niako_4093 [Niastella koreensis GR20-10]|uniref:DUF4302 domain-containing protein n=2 Tax=Niastella koreensis TaxID=354356 RepID=G8TC65_NIAKG|nr:DUF4302 domain-containing protein [Niastella koreensis]AEW00372.1 hypothetical protein Niako_4093 [Niastella koreensis GR20-10]